MEGREGLRVSGWLLAPLKNLEGRALLSHCPRSLNLSELKLFKVIFSDLSAVFGELLGTLPGLGKPVDFPAGTGHLGVGKKFTAARTGRGPWGKVGGKRGGEGTAQRRFAGSLSMGKFKGRGLHSSLLISRTRCTVLRSYRTVCEKCRIFRGNRLTLAEGTRLSRSKDSPDRTSVRFASP